jgi:hypothetical protein
VASFTQAALCLEKDHCTGGWFGPIARVDAIDLSISFEKATLPIKTLQYLSLLA